MLTRNGHGLAAYALLILGMCHWLAARELAADAELTTAAEPD